MKEIVCDRDYTIVGYYRSVLEEAQIPCFIRNEHSHNSLTDLPSPLFFPVLCVAEDEDYDRAKALIDERRHPQAVTGPDWKCASCSEEVPSSFDLCWKCGTARPA